MIRSVASLFTSLLARLLRVFFALLGTTTLLAALIVAMACIVLENPERHLNPRLDDQVLREASHLLGPSGVVLDWEILNLSIGSDSFFKKRISLQAKNICLALPSSGFLACSKELDTQLSVDLSHPNLGPKALGKTAMEHLKWRVASGENQTIRGKSSVQIGSGTNERRGQIAGQVWLPGIKEPISTEILATLGTQGIHLKLKAHLKNVLGRNETLDIQDCQINYVSTGRNERELATDCRLLGASSLKELRFLHSRQQIEAQVQSHLKVTRVDTLGLPTVESEFAGPLSVKLRSQGQPLYKINVDASTLLSGTTRRPVPQWLKDSRVKALVEVPKFEGFVRLFKGSALEIPAPLAVLKGPLALNVDAAVNLPVISVPFTIQTDLKSPHQALAAKGEGVFTLGQDTQGFHPKMELNVLLPNVVLELPKLGLESPPPVVGDPRFAKKKSSGPAFPMKISIRTPDGMPAKLLSNLAQAPIPIGLNLNLQDTAPLAGGLEIQSFPLELFRRNAKVSKFSLRLTSPMEDSEVDGWIDVDYVDYKVTIHIYSTLKNPQVQLSSDPPLPENQVIAVLLFGQPLSELDPDQTASVGDTQAALTNRAVNLASLYVLASTPIQSVGYDPTSGTVTAKFKVAEGTSLNLGNSSGTRTRSIGIQKRIGPHWTAKTAIDHTSESDSVSGYLEWHIRY